MIDPSLGAEEGTDEGVRGKTGGRQLDGLINGKPARQWMREVDEEKRAALKRLSDVVQSN